VKNKPKKVLEIGGGLSTLLISKAIKVYGGDVRVVEHNPFWISFIQSRITWQNVEVVDKINYTDVEFVFVDNGIDACELYDKKIPTIVDNRESLCHDLQYYGFKFNKYLKIGVNF
jgi:hypothetical protein